MMIDESILQNSIDGLKIISSRISELDTAQIEGLRRMMVLSGTWEQSATMKQSMFDEARESILEEEPDIDEEHLIQRITQRLENDQIFMECCLEVNRLHLQVRDLECQMTSNERHIDAMKRDFEIKRIQLDIDLFKFKGGNNAKGT